MSPFERPLDKERAEDGGNGVGTVPAFQSYIPQAALSMLEQAAFDFYNFDIIVFERHAKGECLR